MWGLPYQVIKQLRGGHISNTRVWNTIFEWRPRFTSVYILHNYFIRVVTVCCFYLGFY